MLLIEYYLNFRDKIESLNTFDEIGGFMFQYMGEMTINVNKLKNKLSDTENKLSDTKNKLSDAKNELSDAKNRLSDAENKLSDAKNRLSDAENRLSDAKNKLKQIDSTIKNIIITLFKDGYSVERVVEKFSLPLAKVLEIHEEYLLSVN